MSLRPLNNRIIIDPDPFEYRDTNPDIVRILKEKIVELPDGYEFSFKKSAPTGKLVSWGNQCKYKDCYKVGMKVWYAQFAANSLTIEDNEYKIINEWDLHMLEEEDD